MHRCPWCSWKKVGTGIVTFRDIDTESKMDLCWTSIGCWAVGVYCAIQLVRLALGDADLSLLYYEKFGKPVSSLAGRVVWITGASSGIGEHLAYELAAARCKLVISARRQPELEKVKKQCLVSGRLTEDDILVLPLDMLDTAAHKTAAEKVLKVFGHIDILVNNAGRSQRAMAADTDFQVDKDMMDINFFSVVSLTKAVLPHFIERRQGHLVVTSSIAGKMGVPGSATYCATKFACHGWFDALRAELVQENIDVTMVCPGPVFSEITQHAFTETSGRIHGIAARPGERRMATSRCATLMAVAMANGLEEVWVTRQPVLLFSYIYQYMPALGRWLGRRIGVKIVKAMRDGKM